MRPHSSPDKTVYILHTYDANGMRTSRTNGTTAYNYVYNGGSLSQMTVSGNTLNFAYDASGMPMMVTYNGTNYYYIVNLQGDVMGIADSTGTIVVNYTYDAWGKPLSITGSMADTLGVQNPLRYRGYVYDIETGYYYLQSRYYDPEIGRFINADAFIATGQGMLGNNMFAYCRNNPVIRKDASGTDDVCVVDFNEDNNPLNDLGNPSGRGSGGAAVSTTGPAVKVTNPTHNGNVNNNLSVEDFLKSNGAVPDDVLSCFSGTPELKTLTKDTEVFRNWGGTTPEKGHWVSPVNYGAEARELLSLPPGNTMTHTTSFLVPAGTTVLVGYAAPYFGHLGGGIQWWVCI